jgi:hypothetical protein
VSSHPEVSIVVPMVYTGINVPGFLISLLFCTIALRFHFICHEKTTVGLRFQENKENHPRQKKLKQKEKLPLETIG